MAISAAFSSEVLSEGYNSEVMEIDAEHFVVLRVSKHNQPALKSLDEVRVQIVNALADDIARSAIRESANSLLQQLHSGATIEELALANEFEWQVELAAKRSNRAVPRSLLRRAFELPPPQEGASSFEYVQNSDGDIEMFELVRVIAGDASRMSKSQRQSLERSLGNEARRRTDNYYQQELLSRADIVRS